MIYIRAIIRNDEYTGADVRNYSEVRSFSEYDYEIDYQDRAIIISKRVYDDLASREIVAVYPVSDFIAEIA